MGFAQDAVCHLHQPTVGGERGRRDGEVEEEERGEVRGGMGGV